jgi:hypothetical protein
MPQHVDMKRERQPSGFASPLNHTSNAHGSNGWPRSLMKT